jgi:hypothetical protein
MPNLTRRRHAKPCAADRPGTLRDQTCVATPAAPHPARPSHASPIPEPPNPALPDPEQPRLTLPALPRLTRPHQNASHSIRPHLQYQATPHRIRPIARSATAPALPKPAVPHHTMPSDTGSHGAMLIGALPIATCVAAPHLIAPKLIERCAAEPNLRNRISRHPTSAGEAIPTSPALPHHAVPNAFAPHGSLPASPYRTSPPKSCRTDPNLRCRTSPVHAFPRATAHGLAKTRPALPHPSAPSSVSPYFALPALRQRSSPDIPAPRQSIPDRTCAT